MAGRGAGVTEGAQEQLFGAGGDGRKSRLCEPCIDPQRGYFNWRLITLQYCIGFVSFLASVAGCVVLASGVFCLLMYRLKIVFLWRLGLSYTHIK